MKFIYNIAGIAGTECAVMLAMAAAALMLSGDGMSFDAVQLASGNF
ncbi:MAG: hypothetical protein P8J20_03670 [Novosphingobium sp.]|nr:hypothetical protein [Novosphingobium sp.]